MQMMTDIQLHALVASQINLHPYISACQLHNIFHSLLIISPFINPYAQSKKFIKPLRACKFFALELICFAYRKIGFAKNNP